MSPPDALPARPIAALPGTHFAGEGRARIVFSRGGGRAIARMRVARGQYARVCCAARESPRKSEAIFAVFRERRESSAERQTNNRPWGSASRAPSPMAWGLAPWATGPCAEGLQVPLAAHCRKLGCFLLSIEPVMPPLTRRAYAREPSEPSDRDSPDAPELGLHLTKMGVAVSRCRFSGAAVWAFRVGTMGPRAASQSPGSRAVAAAYACAAMCEPFSPERARK